MDGNNIETNTKIQLSEGKLEEIVKNTMITKWKATGQYKIYLNGESPNKIYKEIF